MYRSDAPGRPGRDAYVVRNADGSTEGLDPRLMDRGLLAALHDPVPLLRAIRAKCLDCCCYQEAEVRRCTAVYCALWPYRMGTNPFRKVADGAVERGRRLNEVRAASKHEITEVGGDEGDGGALG
jgi:hypothetical protein